METAAIVRIPRFVRMLLSLLLITAVATLVGCVEPEGDDGDTAAPGEDATADGAGGDAAFDVGDAADDASPVDARGDADAGDTGPVCGDGLAEGDEACDGDDLRGETCVSQGFVSGTLACGSECAFDTSGCSDDPGVTCGDGVAEEDEECDGEDLRDVDCSSFGFRFGRVGCTDTCTVAIFCNNAPICGDGIVEGEETCDDGNDASGDGCSFDCQEERCGDGIVQLGLAEECEPGSSLLVDCGGEPGVASCEDDCTLGEFDCPDEARCGDGTVDLGEECDDGNTEDGDGCSATCESEFCGDGVVSEAEACDDAAALGATCGDFGFGAGTLRCIDCSINFARCRTPRCGDGFVDDGEECDDGNDTRGDGCNPSCRRESCGDGVRQVGLGEQCDGGDVNGVRCENFGMVGGAVDCSDRCRFDLGACEPAPRCGDGELDEGEECDDGNDTRGDGCSPGCRAESCGDGFVQPELGEACEPGVTPDEDCGSLGFSFGRVTCSDECSLVVSCSNRPVCGDGTREGEEECDDGNVSAGDGCGPECLLEFCGDGIVQRERDESCEPGSSVLASCGDGVFGIAECTVDCRPGEPDCPDPARCGDGELDPGEACDDGNTESGDGCSATCESETCGDGVVSEGESCDDEVPLDVSCRDLGFDAGELVCSACTVQIAGCRFATCGDGLVDGDEECDDGNILPGDGCSPRCEREFCGDGIRQDGLDEQCDGDDVPSLLCTDFGLVGGAVACTDSCQIDVSGCAVADDCGDGEVTGAEECDDGNTESGDGCSAGCRDEFCGDGFVQEGLDEQCEPDLVLDVDCVDLGFHVGTPACTEECTIDDSACELVDEICDNELDDDLDGLIDCLDEDCAGSVACPTPCEGDDDCGTGEKCAGGSCVELESCDNGVDDDLDGLIDCVDFECFAEPACADGLRVVLEWTTPGDSDPDDEEGANLDLFLRTDAGCFDDPDEAISPRNPDVEWNDPGLDIDDPVVARSTTAAPGPEIIALTEPGDFETYLVGVEYVSDGGFGPSTAALTIISEGETIYSAEVTLDATDDWWMPVALRGTGADSLITLDVAPEPISFGTDGVSCVEVCGNDADEDADGLVDCEDTDCAGAPVCDPCADVVCDVPPAPACADSGTLVTFEPVGECVDGECTYAEVRTDCGPDELDICLGGACVDVGEPAPDAMVVVPADGSDVVSRVRFNVESPAADVVFNMDTTGSMGGELSALRSGLSSTVIPSLREALSNTRFAVTNFEDFPCESFGSVSDLPFELVQRATSEAAAAQSAVNGLTLGAGADQAESGLEALYQIATGAGREGDCVDIPAFDPGVGLVDGVADGPLGGVGIRFGAMPIIAHITDAPSHFRGDETEYPYGASRTEAIAAMRNAGARIVGIDSSGGFVAELDEIALDVGATVLSCAWDGARPLGCEEGACCTDVDGSGRPDVSGLCPLNYAIGGDGSGLAAAVSDGVDVFSRFAQFDEIDVTILRDETELASTGVDTSCFVAEISGTEFTPPEHECFLDSGRAPGDAFPDEIPVGAQLDFALTSALAGCAVPSDAPTVYRAAIRLVSRGQLVHDELTIAFVVEPDDGTPREICDNGVDDDGDGAVDCDDPGCARVPLCDPCAGVVCDEPPTAFCSENAAFTFGEGFCELGECIYEETTTDCTELGRACVDGACVRTCTDECELGSEQCGGPDTVQRCEDFDGDGCSEWGGDVLCEPDSVCVVDSAAAFCMPTVETDCFDGVDNDGDGLSDCADDDCVEEPACSGCEGVVCDTPPLSTCDAEIAVSFVDPGSCAFGECSYDERRVDCSATGRTCTEGTCIATTELDCGDGDDEDGDGLVDCDDPDCEAECSACSANGDCDEGEFCEFPLGDCGHLGASGSCVPVPTSCSGELSPVCTCDGTNEINACQAQQSIVSLRSLGSCSRTPEFLCADGVDGDQDELTDCEDDDCFEDPACAAAECGNFEVEEGEECDDGNTEPGDGCSESCAYEPARAPTAGELVITEFMAVPDAPEPKSFEWIELISVSTFVLDLSGVEVRNDRGESFFIPDDTFVLPSRQLTLASTAMALPDGANVEWGGSEVFSLPDDTGSIIVSTVDFAGEMIDRVDYEAAGEPPWPIAPGVSTSLAPGSTVNTLDNDNPANWCAGEGDYGVPGNAGTPGAGNNLCGPTTEANCTDGADGDGDGLVDCADPDCSGDAACATGEICDNGPDDDGDGRADCIDPDCFADAACGDGLRFELTWVTPGDPDETDRDGSDLDIHLLNATSDGCWLDPVDDCHWNAANPDWGEPGVDDADPSLVLDDVSGQGPELIELDWTTPPVGAVYWLAAHYFDDGGFGASEVTLRVYNGSVVVVEIVAIAEATGSWILGAKIEVLEGGGLSFSSIEDIAFVADLRTGPSCTEVCDSGIDEDFDGTLDCADADCTGDPACGPAETECADGLDNDADGPADCADPDCEDDPACAFGETECADSLDNDADGLIDCDDSDCAEDAACREPVAEICDNGVDDDLDGDIDEDDADCPFFSDSLLMTIGRPANVDVAYLMDRTASMSEEQSAVRSEVGAIESEIETFYDSAASALVVYDGFPCDAPVEPGTPFNLIQRATTDILPIVGQFDYALGGDADEAFVEALYQLGTGEGRSLPDCGDGFAIPSFDPAAGRNANANGEIGGVGFRSGSFPWIFHVTDEGSVANGEEGFTLGATRAEAEEALQTIGARYVGFATGSAALAELDGFAMATSTVVPTCAWGDTERPAGCSTDQCCTGLDGAGRAAADGLFCPLVYEESSDAAGLGDQMREAVREILAHVVLPVEVVLLPDPELLSTEEFDTTTIVRFDGVGGTGAGGATCRFGDPVAVDGDADGVDERVNLALEGDLVFANYTLDESAVPFVEGGRDYPVTLALVTDAGVIVAERTLTWRLEGTP